MPGKGVSDVRAGTRRKRAHPRKRTLSLVFAWGREGGAERGWIKASTRGGNKERTKKVEEVGGGGWVPWSALIGSTWSDEKFNHPPIPTRPNSLPPPSPPRYLHLLCFPLSFSLSRAIVSFTLSHRLNSHQMNLPHIYARPVVCKFLRIRARRHVKPASTAVFVNTQHRFRLEFNYSHSLVHLMP